MTGAPSVRQPAGIGAVRWRIAILLCLITTINYVDRLAFAVATPTLRDRFGFTASDIGDFGLAFLAAYALGQLFGGRVVDRFGVRRSYGVAVAVWSLACIAHAFGQGRHGFMAARVALGLGEAINFPAAFKAVAEWFPRAERSMAVGIVTLGVGFGSIIAPPFVAALILHFGWQAAFIVPGALGLLWLLLWRRSYDSPERHPRLGDAERTLILAGRDDAPAGSPPQRWSVLLRQPQTWLLMLSRFVADGAFYFIVFFLPLYLVDARGLDLKAVAMFAWLPFAFADLGSFLGGWVSMRLVRAGWSVASARSLTIWLGAGGALAALPAAYTGSVWGCIALICLTLFAIQFKQANLFTLPADLFPARDVATVWGLFGAAGSIGGGLFTRWSGRLVDAVGYDPVFVVVAGLHLVSAAVAMLALRGLRRGRGRPNPTDRGAAGGRSSAG